MDNADLVWGFSQAYFWVLFLPALIHVSLVALRRSRSADKPRNARALGWAVMASVLAVLYVYNGNPRVRVSSDPIVIALAACAWSAAIRMVRERWPRR